MHATLRMYHGLIAFTHPRSLFPVWQALCAVDTTALASSSVAASSSTWRLLQVLRQYSIAMGLGQKRPKPRRGTKPKLGTEGEDVVTDDAGHMTLVVPARFGLGTVKGAAYKVLQDVGPEGLSITEIARRIQEQGLRDLTTSKTPEVRLVVL